METRLYKTLEYDKILVKLKEKTMCCVSRELVEKLEPSNNIEDVRSALQLTAEASALLSRTGQSPIDAFPDMRECLKRSKAALFLSTSELLGIAKCLRAANIARDLIIRDGNEGFLVNLADLLVTHRSIEEEINRCIISEDEIFDGASIALARIRRAMRLANEKVRERLNSMIRSSTYQKYLQEPLITIRNGRFVIPVKQEYRQNVPGLIHDQSGSGATLFIEPNAVVELGNEYKKLQSEEAEEIERILTELTAMLVPYADDIIEDLAIMGRIDLVFAKAALAREMKAVCPELNSNGKIRIVRGRHPLISSESVVPLDIWVGDDFKELIITGPNTGGKTVALKTVGLLTLMAQSGMFIPAADGSELAVFYDVYADIGDEQSIEQSLSTFSSHMSHIVSILDKADAHSLVLLDELGAGTDPLEGAALAMSILDELHERNSICLCTTHYSEVKAFALTREGIENASMEFDVDKLCPTYKLFIGIPGKSNAFEISKRLGLSDRMIERARKFLKGEDVKFEDIISSAQSQHRIAEHERQMAQEARIELEKLRSDAEKERKKINDERDKLRAKAKEESKRIVSETKREMEKLITQIRMLKDIDRSSADRVIQASRDAMRAVENSLAEPFETKSQTADRKPLCKVNIGQTVLIASLDKKATVISACDSKGEVMVQAGIMKMSIPLSDLCATEDDAPAKGSVKSKLVSKTVGLELDIRGMMVDDAEIVVDRYLEDARNAGLTEVNIIHGKGTGALRAGIQNYLKGHRSVKSFRMGSYGEGDAGVTVVQLKQDN